MYNPNGASLPRRRACPSVPDDALARSILSRSDLPKAPDTSRPVGAPSRSHMPDPAPAPAQYPSSSHPHALAMVYALAQPFDNLYDEDTALSRGTLFASLDFPFEGSKCGKERC